MNLAAVTRSGIPRYHPATALAPMTRFLLSLLAAQLIALAVSCDSPTSGLSAAQAYDAARQANQDGDYDRAIDLLKESAKGGHLDALAHLANGYGKGQVLIGSVRPDQVIPIRVSPFRAQRYQRAYERALADSMQAGHSRAFLHAATLVMGVRIAAIRRDDMPVRHREHWDAVDIDSAKALYGRIDPAELHGQDLAMLPILGQALGDTTVLMTMYERAVADGDPGACIYKIIAEHGQPDMSTTAGLAAYDARMAECADAFPEAGTRERGRSAGMVGSREVRGGAVHKLAQRVTAS